MSALLNVPETATRDEIVQIKILVNHPMETGFRTGRDGALIPRDIIHALRCDYAGATVFEAELFPAVAANPFFAFYLRAVESGEVTLTWRDESGAEHSLSRPITVT